MKWCNNQLQINNVITTYMNVYTKGKHFEYGYMHMQDLSQHYTSHLTCN